MLRQSKNRYDKPISREVSFFLKHTCYKIHFLLSIRYLTRAITKYDSAYSRIKTPIANHLLQAFLRKKNSQRYFTKTPISFTTYVSEKMKSRVFLDASSFETKTRRTQAIVYRLEIDDEAMLSTTPVCLRGESFFDFASPRKRRAKQRKRKRKTWECLIENYSVECILASDDCAPAARVVGLSFGVHVRLARVSCGATLPIPGCLQDCNIVSGRGMVDGRG